MIIPVVGACIRHEGKIFLARRTEAMGLGGIYEFPGGKIEDGETPEEAIVREVDEELGFRVRAGKPLVTFQNTRSGKTYEITIYEAMPDEDIRRIVLAEHDDSAWVDTADNGLPMTDHEREALRSILKK